MDNYKIPSLLLDKHKLHKLNSKQVINNSDISKNISNRKKLSSSLSLKSSSLHSSSLTSSSSEAEAATVTSLSSSTLSPLSLSSMSSSRNLDSSTSCICNKSSPSTSNICCYNSHYHHKNHNLHRNYSTKKMESGFYKFLARFSGRRRDLLEGFHKFVPVSVFILIVVSSLTNFTEACSSRTTPKPRPPPTPAPRPNITFHTYKCPPNYAKWYCLNEATCFTVKIGDEILYNCECADGYMGPRCEYKDLDGSYLPTRPRIMLETASIASGATLALIFVFILCIMLYIRWQQRQKSDTLSSENGNIESVDTVDGLESSGTGYGPGTTGADEMLSTYVKCEHHRQLRPFGPHHHYTIPMAATLKR